MQKYGFEDARPILERASARETAARVALGEVAARLLAQAYGIGLVSHTVAIGTAALADGAAVPEPGDVDALDADPVRTLDAAGSAAMVASGSGEEGRRHARRVVEVIAYDVPPGLGSHRPLGPAPGRAACRCPDGDSGNQGVEVGDGFAIRRRRGSQAHDEMQRDADGVIRRRTGRAGGPRAACPAAASFVRAVKPISTVPRSLDTVDIADPDAEAKAIHQRSDVCAVPAAGVVAEAMVALVLAEACLEGGGDPVAETRRNFESYLAAIPAGMRSW